ncbi:hypothetical protein N7457_007868 [Penicillium paradoxum]|uniref:uncharacterized protein n=1 Tax=Penicillium paradoxum TaxID=176176 RepID=UPI0025489A79|nr:uncharacterized protein N7457_007868 [Penicillium paradoxum]KAJ5772972.1 hypothetical protein N7457_007868 [Penicillium paradoxum]
MRFTSLVTLLPALAMAQEQAPLADRVQGWFNQVKSFVPTAVPVAPVEKLAEKVTEKNVTPVTMENWQSILSPGPEPENWFIYTTGGNKTCFGRCGTADQAFKESVLLFSADPTSPNLGLLDCEANQVLCAAWSASAPSVMYYQVPKEQPAGEERAPTPLHNLYLNSTTVTADTIYNLHAEKNYEKFPAYEGALHPIDGWVAKYQLSIPMGYVIWGLGAVPSWLFMIGISFFSRTMMGRRMGPTGNAPRAAPAGGAN